jgi:N-acetylglucosaminyl-diphospho-decaprenol L-rhamnosyltransferase
LISFLIVNWNGGSVLRQCLESIDKKIRSMPDTQSVTIVVHNGGTGLGSWTTTHPLLRIHINARNRFFAKGTNQSVRLSQGDILFFLNNDVVLDDGCVANLVARLKQNDAAVPCLRYPHGDIQHSVRNLPTASAVLSASIGLDRMSRVFDAWLMHRFDYSIEQRVQQPMFSAVMMTRDTWYAVGELDERYPILFNDVDWFARFRALGKKCIFVPSATAIHIHGMSVNRHPFRKVFVSTVSMYRFLSSRQRFAGLRPLVAAACSYYVRILGEVVRKAHRSKRTVKAGDQSD